MSSSVFVTKPFLPPIDEYNAYLKKIWSSQYVTNQGPLLKEFEAKIRQRVGGEYFHFVSNGTAALQVALKSLGISEGEIITTPFSYVATTSAILWERCTPVFVDIEPETYCIDPDRIEDAITENTKAILAVHVFGHKCAVEKIGAIAQKHKIKVIYDGAHAFGTKTNGKSILHAGDITMLSFHATKPFHTIEGGGLITDDPQVSEKIELIKRFGHQGDEHFMLGINAKASEFQAAMGLCNLQYIDDIIQQRRKWSELYDSMLKNKVKRPRTPKQEEYNHAYYPIIVESEGVLQNVFKKLEKQNIHPRRYFYPSLNTLPYIGRVYHCPVSEDISKRIMCLPLHHDLDEKTITTVCEEVLSCV